MSIHLDEGTLQAFLDDELATGERSAAAEHMLACEQCRTAHEGLKRANALFSDAVSSLDADSVSALPPAPARPVARARWGAGSLVKAAGLILFLAAAASAAVPGSPVRLLVERVVQRDAPEEPATAAAPAPAEPPAPQPVGLVVLPASGALEVSIRDFRHGSIRVRLSGADEASVSALGTTEDPTFESGSGRIGVRGGSGGSLMVELPETLRAGRVLVDGQVYAEVTDGRLRVLVPARELGGELVWE